ncbi:MAG: hypothetical protein K9G76_01755 [Bacteroidales bacterium]|nr:hypothetical protein [Bacteroidales bacterium]MCF8403279.1 hypothetical protein [Bacteroidales bacterium]
MLSKIVYLASIYVLLPVMLISQEIKSTGPDKDYQKFSQTLNKETTYQQKNSGQLSNYVLHPVQLPAWFFKPSDADSNYIYGIGISEPGMPEKEAFELATLRAKSVIALLSNATLKTMADNFIQESNGEKGSDFTTKFTNFYRVEAREAFDTSGFVLVDTYFTSFNEAICLFKYHRSKNLPNSYIKVVADVYQAERQKHNTFEAEERFDCSGKLFFGNDSSSFHYMIHSFNNVFEITSKVNSDSLIFPYFNFRYTQSDEDTQQYPANFQSKLNYGLWKSFFEVFLQELYFIAQNPDVSVKQIGDVYTDQTLNLARETTHVTLPVELRNLYISNNHFAMKLDLIK